MNKRIKQQLANCRVAVVPAFDDTTTHLIIESNRPQVSNISTEDLVPNCYYEVMVENYIINEPSTFTLSANWNNGTKPPEYHLYIQVLQVMGKMVRVAALGVDTKKSWSGWLPKKAIQIIQTK